MEEFEEQEIKKLVEKFKDMIDSSESKYFDSEEMELIIDDFIRSFDFPLAGEAIDYAISLFPENSFFRILRVKKLILELRLEAAEKELDEIENTFPPSAEFYLEKVLLMRMTGSDKDAFKLLRKAYLLSPDDPEIHFFLTYEYLKRKNILKALDHITFALKADNSFDDQLFTYSYLFEESKQYEDALFFYTTLTEKFPLLKGGWFGLGLAYSWLNDHPNAIQAYQLSLSLDEDMPTAHFNIANSYYELKEYDKALEHYNLALSLDNQDFNSLASIGDCYACMDQNALALDYYHKALEFNPHHYDAIMGIISILQLSGRIKEAELFIIKAFTINPQSFELLFSVIETYDEHDQLEKLKELFGLTLDQIENKTDFFHYFVLYCCQNDFYNFGLEIIAQYRDEKSIEKMVDYYQAAFHYLNGNINEGNKFLCDALTSYYEEYPNFLALDPILESFSEIQELIEIFRPQ